MALSSDEADSHITKWEQELDKAWYSHRKLWPSRLFHHAPLENAISILADGNFRARDDPSNLLPRDIAGAGIIDLRVDAHSFVRLYFRPRTPTQFHIEGIRKPNECAFGFQAPILVMFVLDARRVFTRPGTIFSNENMQRHTACTGDTAAFLSDIPFEKVFHEGGLGGDNSIIAHRCAEVLAASPLALEESLQWIFCRSEAERETVLYAVGRNHPWASKIRVSDDIRVFNRLFCYVESVRLSTEGVLFEIHPRNDGKNISIILQVYAQAGNVVAQFQSDDFRPVPLNAKRWITAAQLIPGEYVVQIHIEQELAYKAVLTVGDDLV